MAYGLGYCSPTLEFKMHKLNFCLDLWISVLILICVEETCWTSCIEWSISPGNIWTPKRSKTNSRHPSRALWMCGNLQRYLCGCFIKDSGNGCFPFWAPNFCLVLHNLVTLQLSGQSFISDEKSSAATLLSSISEIGTSLFTTLEAQFSVAFDEDQRLFSRNSSLIEEQRKVLSERLNSTIKLFVSSEPSSLENEHVRNSLCCSEYKVAAWSQLKRYFPLVMILFSALLLKISYMFLNHVDA